MIVDYLFVIHCTTQVSRVDRSIAMDLENWMLSVSANCHTVAFYKVPTGSMIGYVMGKANEGCGSPILTYV